MQMALARWGAWFRRGWPWWCTVGLAVAGWLTMQCVPTTEDNVRRVGMVYETLGMLLVLVDVAAATKKHRLQWPWQRFARYWGDIPVRNRVINLRVAPAVMKSFSPSVKVRVDNPSGATLEERVATLERKLQGAETAVDRLESRLAAEEQTRLEADKAEAASRVQADNQLRESIKGLEVGSLDLTVFGLLWLFVGMVMTTGTPELCMVLDCVPQEAASVQKDENRTIRAPAWPSTRT